MSPGHADRRPTEDGGTATKSAGRQNARIARPTSNDLRLGCPAGCSACHDCGVGPLIEVPACNQRCFTIGVASLQYFGEVYGCCPCLIEGGAA